MSELKAELDSSLLAMQANCNFMQSRLDEMSLEFMKRQDEIDALIAERDLLRQQLDVAMRALTEARMELGNGFHLRLFPLLDDALAEIAKLGEKK